MTTKTSFPPFDHNTVISFDSADTREKYANLPSGMVRRSNSVQSSVSNGSRSSEPYTSRPNTRPSSPVIIESAKSPDVVVLCLWTHATAAQIDFYIAGYETLYPSTRILLLQWPSWTMQNSNLDDVLDVLTNCSEKPALQAPTVMLHLFGQIGALSACNLLRAYRLRTLASLNAKAIVSDTEPQITLTTLFQTLQTPYTFLPLLLAFMLNFVTFFLTLWNSNTETNRIRADLTNPSLLPSNVRKCFVFAGQDVMFSWGEESEDGEAERRDYAVKRTSVDARGRWTGDQERYWLGIEGVWEGR